MLRESYEFSYAKEEFIKIIDHIFGEIKTRTIMVLILTVGSFLVMLMSSEFNIAHSIVFLIIILFANAKNILNYRKGKKAWQEGVIKASQSTYIYEIYDDYWDLKIYRGEELVKEIRTGMNRIQQIRSFGDYFIVHTMTDSHIFKKSQLADNSVLYFLFQNFKNKTLPPKAKGIWKVLSRLTFISSIVAVFVGLLIESLLSDVNHMTLENSWVFLLLIPIPALSIIVGNKLRKKGFKYRKNHVVGFIMMAMFLLCGVESFFYRAEYDYSEDYITKIEEYTSIDIADAALIKTRDWSKYEQEVERGLIFYTSQVYYEENQIQELEKGMKEEQKWLADMPEELENLFSSLSVPRIYDYSFIYNVDTGEFNTLPSENGKYRFITAGYTSWNQEIEIVEYELEYVK